MNPRTAVCCASIVGAGLLLAGCSHPTPAGTVVAAPTRSTSGTHVAAATGHPPPGVNQNKALVFTPPPESAIPDDAFGAMVRKGEAIFTHTRINAGGFVGNDLNCSNCHLDAGRRANSAPLWGAYVRYPMYRAKNHQVNSFAERLQGCFRFSMNGKAPPADGEIIKALTTYAFWLSHGAPTGVTLAGAGFPKHGFVPPEPPSYARGQQVFEHTCALCHGAEGQGQRVAGTLVFPPLWGPESFNWGAGMGNLDNAAAFIKANMPFSRGGILSDQAAWDVAYFMDAHERPQDPRFTGSVAATRKTFHDTKMSLYGTVVNGHLLGSAPAGKTGVH
ncbi:MAG: c-type cytochrome [Rhodanobacteraceae bacterium]|nr:MAG: c-type cytochrome [Rhodanobacteraceae bacterium]